ncbi:hypothetical protein HMPREF0373_02591 [Eubacterium ramulus ATCC 29099]|uniref:Uncharacterized protein n=1 Tax=Eubacterium ramulus ATCC 29099 TaxID=1256908 RepID=U2NY96_EUBRA|nr:hypothetical protein HMPREF0373_02591 [Eubacterium ramulus ATCC 29099]
MTKLSNRDVIRLFMTKLLFYLFAGHFDTHAAAASLSYGQVGKKMSLLFIT